MRGGEEKEKKRNDTSRSNLWLTDDRNSLEQEAKFVNAIKATLWYRNMNFFVEVPKGRGFTYTSYFLPSGYGRDILVQL